MPDATHGCRIRDYQEPPCSTQGHQRLARNRGRRPSAAYRGGSSRSDIVSVSRPALGLSRAPIDMPLPSGPWGAGFPPVNEGRSGMRPCTNGATREGVRCLRPRGKVVMLRLGRPVVTPSSELDCSAHAASKDRRRRRSNSRRRHLLRRWRAACAPATDNALSPHPPVRAMPPGGSRSQATLASTVGPRPTARGSYADAAR